MKKIITTAAVLAAMGLMSVSAFADSIYFTVANEYGKIGVAHEKVEVDDVDGDGALTINDALINAHDQLFAGGAEAGYASAEGDYGLYITKLWGTENGGSYGYYVNNVAAMGLSDPIKDGDHLNAFVYTDTETFSDTYCYFDTDEVTSDTGDVELTLYAAAFDENWSPITVPVEDAKITVNREDTEFVTDKDGKVTVKFTGDGEFLISAVSDTQTLVPPACIATVVLNNTAEAAPATGDVAAATDSSKGSPDTGIADVSAVVGVAILAAGAIIAAKSRK